MSTRNDSAALSDIERSARWALNRHYYGMGRWGYKNGEFPRVTTHEGWTLSREEFPGDPIWAKTLPGPRGQKGKKVHAFKYRVMATKGNHRFFLTVWKCGQHTNGSTEVVVDPVTVCGGCYDRIHHRGSVRLSTGA